jgi:hypothetical protein
MYQKLTKLKNLTLKMIEFIKQLHFNITNNEVAANAFVLCEVYLRGKI